MAIKLKRVYEDASKTDGTRILVVAHRAAMVWDAATGRRLTPPMEHIFLNNGVVDCGVTGSLSGNTAGWNEVTKSIYPMSLGWSINVLAINLDSWKRLDPKVQAFLVEQTKAYEDKMWATVKTTTAEAVNCNTGKQPCTMGKLAKTTIVPVKPEEMETHKKLVEGAVLAGWAKRCGVECAKEWNETVGKMLGLKAPTP